MALTTTGIKTGFWTTFSADASGMTELVILAKSQDPP
jgi:hypothetical protein